MNYSKLERLHWTAINMIASKMQIYFILLVDFRKLHDQTINHRPKNTKVKDIYNEPTGSLGAVPNFLEAGATHEA